MKGLLAHALEGELRNALELSLPGLEFLDRELEIVRGGSRARAASLVARAAGPTLVLIEELEGPLEKAAVRALELAALQREHGRELLGRFGCAQGPTLALLAGEHASELCTLLAPLLGRELRLFSATLFKTRAGSRLALVELAAGRAERAPLTREEFLGALDARARALAERLWERLSSPALGARAEIGSELVRWSDARGALCSLARADGGLCGRLTGLDEAIELGNEADGRGFLDAVLALHLERSAAGMESPAAEASQAAFDPRTPLLSEAEIAAFHGA